MTVYHIPRPCTAILFDVDSTLYTHPEYQQVQLELPVRRLAGIQGKSFDQMNGEITRYREKIAEEQGVKVSLGTAFTAFGVSIAESVRWREELYHPEQYLKADRRLRACLEPLAAVFRLAIVTNNPVSIGRRTLAALGVEELFTAFVGLDTCGVSKPHQAPYRTAAELCAAAPAACVSVGDRYEIDIALPLEMGMGGILVDGVEDVYKLPELLIGKR